MKHGTLPGGNFYLLLITCFAVQCFASAVYISNAWFTPHNFSPYFQVQNVFNELLQVEAVRRREASCLRVWGSLICPPYLTDIQHTKHPECVADIWTERQPHGRLPLHVQTVVHHHIKIKATTSLESCFSFLFQILEHRKAYCKNEYVNICTRMHVVSPESKKQTTCLFLADISLHAEQRVTCRNFCSYLMCCFT